MTKPDHLLLIGPPGTGKTMFARRVQTPPKVLAATLRARSYICRASRLDWPGDLVAPFRAPHHTCSKGALLGTLNDGWMWHPGEFSLAHGGVLFLDELPEFRRDAIDALQQPLLRGVVPYHGSNHHMQVPASFQLIAAMNLCPCGRHGPTRKRCDCTSAQIERYQARVPAWLRSRCRVLTPEQYAITADDSYGPGDRFDVPDRV